MYQNCAEQLQLLFSDGPVPSNHTLHDLVRRVRDTGSVKERPRSRIDRQTWLLLSLKLLQISYSGLQKIHFVDYSISWTHHQNNPTDVQELQNHLQRTISEISPAKLKRVSTNLCKRVHLCSYMDLGHFVKDKTCFKVPPVVLSCHWKHFV